PRPEQCGRRQRVRDRVARGQRELLGVAQRRRGLRHRDGGLGLGRHGRRRFLVGAEAERLREAVSAVRTGPAALLVLLEQWRVVGLGVIAGLDGWAQPDLPGDLAARPADRAAGAGLVALVDLQAVVAVLGPRLAAEHLAQFAE